VYKDLQDKDKKNINLLSKDIRGDGSWIYGYEAVMTRIQWKFNVNHWQCWTA
jgi:hypothetical protein